MNIRQAARVASLALLSPILLFAADMPQTGQIDWAKRVENIKPGMTRLQVEATLPQLYGDARQYGEDGITETYWLDDDWVVTLFYLYDNIRDEGGKVIPNVGNNRLGKILTLEQRKHPPAQIPKSEWTYARALQLVLDLRREEIKTLENTVITTSLVKLEWDVRHVPSYGGSVVPHLFIVGLAQDGKRKAAWDVDLHTANVSRRTEDEEKSNKGFLRTGDPQTARQSAEP